MTHEVLLLGLARDTVGRERTTVELAADATVRDLRDGLAALHPELAAILPTCAIAIDHRYREDATAPLQPPQPASVGQKGGEQFCHVAAG